MLVLVLFGYDHLIKIIPMKLHYLMHVSIVWWWIRIVVALGGGGGEGEGRGEELEKGTKEVLG